MDKSYFIKLTTNLYRLTILFPKKEPLRHKLRELADNILANGIMALAESHQWEKAVLELKRDLEIMDGYLELAKNQNWVSPFDVLEIQKEYVNLRSTVEGWTTRETIPLLKDKDTPEPSGTEKTEHDKEIVVGPQEAGKEIRHQRILEVLRQRGRVQVGEMKQVFANVSKRTLRRDFEFLLNQGVVERLGEKNETFYRLKG